MGDGGHRSAIVMPRGGVGLVCEFSDTQAAPTRIEARTTPSMTGHQTRGFEA